MTPPNHLRRRLLSILALAALLFLTACPLPAPAQIPSGYVQTTVTVPSLANGTFGASLDQSLLFAPARRSSAASRPSNKQSADRSMPTVISGSV